jgi:hypothetical protein
MDAATRDSLRALRSATLAARVGVEALRAAAAAKYKQVLAAQAELGSTDLPPRSEAAVLALLDAIQDNGGALPAAVDPPFGGGGAHAPPFLVKFGEAWRGAHAAVLAAEEAEHAAALAAREALSRAAKELHELYPVPSNDALDVAEEVRAARVLAEANAVAIYRLEKAVAALAARSMAPLRDNYSAAECRAAGYSAVQLRGAGFDAGALKAGGFGLAELKAASLGTAKLKAAGFGAPELKSAGFSAAELVAGGFGAELQALFGFRSIAEAKAGGLATPAELFAAGYTTLAAYKGLGFTFGQLCSTGRPDGKPFSSRELVPAGGYGENDSYIKDMRVMWGGETWASGTF